MLQTVNSFWIEIIAPDFFFSLDFTTDPFPPGTNVFVSTSLSFVNTLFAGKDPDPTFAVAAFIDSWTIWKDDGTESLPFTGPSFNQNALTIANCARVTFQLVGQRVAAIAQISVTTLA